MFEKECFSVALANCNYCRPGFKQGRSRWPGVGEEIDGTSRSGLNERRGGHAAYLKKKFRSGWKFGVGWSSNLFEG